MVCDARAGLGRAGAGPARPRRGGGRAGVRDAGARGQRPRGADRGAARGDRLRRRTTAATGAGCHGDVAGVVTAVAPGLIRDGADALQPAGDRAPEWVTGGTPEPLRSQLTAGLGSDRVLTRALDLIAYASDASAYRMIPRAVRSEEDTTELVALFKLARELHVPLVFRAGGTSLKIGRAHV